MESNFEFDENTQSPPPLFHHRQFSKSKFYLDQFQWVRGVNFALKGRGFPSLLF